MFFISPSENFLNCRFPIATNGLRHPPAIPAVMQVFEALLLVWRAAAVGGCKLWPFSFSLSGGLFLFSTNP